jgi:uncharacterized membrane protein
MKKYLSTGLIILLPIALTYVIIRYVLDLFTTPLFAITEYTLSIIRNRYDLDYSHHELLVAFISRSTAFILTFLLIITLGFLGRRYFFKALLSYTNRLLVKIPFIGTIYRLTKDVTQAMFTSGTKAFKETVLVPFPTSESYALAFVTGQPPEILKGGLKELDVTLFVPTAPHPISGYILFANKNMTHPVKMSTEETVRFLISCGVTDPASSIQIPPSMEDKT